MIKWTVILQLFFLSSSLISSAYQHIESKLDRGSIDDLAKKTGFASKLPKQNEIYISYQGLDKLVRSLIGSKIGMAIDELAPEGGALKEQVLEDRDYEEFMTVAGEDMFISGGEKSSKLVEIFARLGSGVIQYQMRQEYLRLIAKLEADEEWWRAGLGSVPEFFKDRSRALALLKNLEISPVYAGFRVSNKEKRDELIKIIREGLNDPIQFQAQNKDKQFFSVAKSDLGEGFSGFKLSGADMAKGIRGERAEKSMIKELGQELYDDAMKEVAKREFVLMAGVVDDYIVFFAGKNVADMRFAPSAAESLLANPEIDFALNYADKDLTGLIFFSDTAMKDIQELRSELPMITSAYTQVMKNSDYFGDTLDIQKLINNVGEKSEFLFDLLPKTRLGVVMYLEDGFKMESYLGKDASVFDLDTKRKLATLANHDGAILSGNWILKPDFSKNCAQLLESATTATQQIFQLAVEQDVHDDDWLEFASNFRVADSEFSDDLVRLYKAMQSGLEGISNEHAIMLDLKGRMPTAVPEIPMLLKEHGLVPRLSYASEVTDRARLSAGWDDMSAASKDLGNGVGKLTKEEVVIPKPVKLSKAGIDLWSYKVENWDHDFQPTLGVNEKLFFLATSPNYIQELAEIKTVATEPGAELVIRLGPAREAANHWLKVFEEYGKEFLSERELAEFQAAIPQIKKFIEVSKQVEKLDIYTRKVDSEIRNTIHFHTK